MKKLFILFLLISSFSFSQQEFTKNDFKNLHMNFLSILDDVFEIQEEIYNYEIKSKYYDKTNNYDSSIYYKKKLISLHEINGKYLESMVLMNKFNSVTKKCMENINLEECKTITPALNTMNKKELIEIRETSGKLIDKYIKFKDVLKQNYRVVDLEKAEIKKLSDQYFKLLQNIK